MSDGWSQVLASVAMFVLSYALMELYLAVRPPDLSEQVREFLGSAHGRFEVWYAESRRPPEAPHGGDPER